MKCLDEKLAVSSWRTETGSFPLLCPLRWADWRRDLPSLQFHFSKHNFEEKKVNKSLFPNEWFVWSYTTSLSCTLFPFVTLSEWLIRIQLFMVFWEWIFFMSFRVMSRRYWLSGAIILDTQSFPSIEIIKWLMSDAFYALRKTKVDIWVLSASLHVLFLLVCLSWPHDWHGNWPERSDLKLLKTGQDFCILWQIRFVTALLLGSVEWKSCGGLGSSKMNAPQKERKNFYQYL